MLLKIDISDVRFRAGGLAEPNKVKGENATAQELPHPLSALRAEFPGHWISLENLCGKIRYVARTLHFGLNPHTVVTNDLDELAAALAPARRYGLPTAQQVRL